MFTYRNNRYTSLVEASAISNNTLALIEGILLILIGVLQFGYLFLDQQ